MAPNGSNKNQVNDAFLQLNLDLKSLQTKNVQAKSHGDNLLGDKKEIPADLMDDLKHVLTLKNAPVVAEVIKKFITTHRLDMKAAAPLVGSLSNNSANRKKLVEKEVTIKYDRMLHPPLTYLGDAFQYRTADGKFNSALHPHLGQAGAPYAKTVPAKTHPLGAMPDPGDIFDKLMARQYNRPSQSGLSSMLLYHATIIIHDVFRTNDNDKNISDSSSYLDLSPLYGYTEEMQRKVRDNTYKLGLLKPDVFAEDRLLRQPPGVCIMLVMYNRYHNYAATQLRRINENGRFSVPSKYGRLKLVAVAQHFCDEKVKKDEEFKNTCKKYDAAWREYEKAKPPSYKDTAESWREIRRLRQQAKPPKKNAAKLSQKDYEEGIKAIHDKIEEKAKAFADSEETKNLTHWKNALEAYINRSNSNLKDRQAFQDGYDAAWTKLDDDLFNTARLITCGMYIQISIHDYLRALMGFHQFNTDFTLEPRGEIDHKNVTRGIGNQVTIEFNLLYRFHCAISEKDETYTKEYMREKLDINEPDELSLPEFLGKMQEASAYEKYLGKVEPWQQEFGLEHIAEKNFQRDPITGLFNDEQMIKALIEAMDEPISNFGPRNTPKCLKPVEIMGIIQARKWGIGTLNDFREFFGMDRHESFESISANADIQDALRDLYEHPDKVELYPGVFCESDANMGVDPGPSDVSSALWAAIFSDAITLVRSDRFYTIDWNTHSLTSWGMREVTPDSDILKSSVFHRLYQRAFPGWFPPDSIRFFHPFYTGQTNAKFAEAQGYTNDFKIPKHINSKPGKPKFSMKLANPRRPNKPLCVKNYKAILDILEDKLYTFVHPVLLDLNNFPPAIRGMIKAATAPKASTTVKKSLHLHGPHGFLGTEEALVLKEYFTNLMQKVLKRESIPMGGSTCQIDLTRDFAIPVVARYISDFLGFGRLVGTKENLRAQFSENEIYRHITNCQTFMGYNADETKILKRRAEFRKSFEFLYEQTLEGNLAEVTKWEIFQRRRDDPMTELGFRVAQRVLQHEKQKEAAAAVIVIIALNSAHNAVFSFTSVMNFFITDLYGGLQYRDPPILKRYWGRVQELAFRDDDESLGELTRLILEADALSVHLPLVRVAQRPYEFDVNGVRELLSKGDTVILDLSDVQPDDSRKGSPAEADFLPFHASVTDAIEGYHPKQLAIMTLTLMVKFFAQMKNLRRGHDAQGRVKLVKLDVSEEGYANYMAPQRVERVKKEDFDRMSPSSRMYTYRPLQPASDTFMNTEWDEMIPFPTTWKLRFDGFGKSNNSTILPSPPKHYDDAPPFYQPRGASHIGGTFAEIACICNGPGVICKCKDDSSKTAPKPTVGLDGLLPAEYEPTYSTGCGITT